MLQHCQEDDALLIYHIDEREQLEAVFYLYEHNREEKEVLEEVLLILEADIGDREDHDKTNRKRGCTVVSTQKYNRTESEQQYCYQNGDFLLFEIDFIQNVLKHLVCRSCNFYI